ncbi:BTAD domain-containing putative transcriptional regulator [Streptomyces sp. NPDC012403]|uniref:AfsR/SARP family transcriptional regulator n=1 Tax=Streptomyces sp. NPDC012403 TaxID=3364831 RepID=UPI0036E022A3
MICWVGTTASRTRPSGAVSRSCPGGAVRRPSRQVPSGASTWKTPGTRESPAAYARVGGPVEDDLDRVRGFGGELPVHGLRGGARGGALGQGAFVGQAEAQAQQGRGGQQQDGQHRGTGREGAAHGGERGAVRRAVELARRAEELWRGEFVEGLRAPYLEAERLRWAEKRLTVLEGLLEGEITLGRAFEHLHELVRLVAAHPLRERLAELLMLALCRTGRSADALAVYEETRRRLTEAMGADPGPGLRSLHARVLRQDPALLPSPPVPAA